LFLGGFGGFFKSIKRTHSLYVCVFGVHYAGAPAAKKIKMEPATSSSTSATASSSSVDYSKMNMADLKKELLSKGLKATGKKSELVDRLKAAASGGVATKTEPKEEEGEETDFSKAKRALAAEAIQKKKGTSKKIKQRKVDSHVPGALNWEVHEDWDCMLNQTNIGHNNNKFYVIQLLKHKSM